MNGEMISIYRKKGNPDLVMKAYQDTLHLWKVPVQSAYVTTSFGLVHVLVAGPEYAEPLVLLHGFGFSSTMWLENIDALSSRYRVYAIDFPGDINKSGSIRPIKNKTDCVTWFTEILDGLDIDKVHVCGHSYGGFITMVLATRLSARIRKVIILSPGAGIQPQNKGFFTRCLLAGMMPTTQRIQNLMDYMTGKGNVINQTLKDQFTIAMQNALPRTKLFVSYIKDNELQQITAPTLLLIGDQDIQYDVEQAMERARRVIHNIEATVIPRAGHGLPLEKPEIVNTYMLDFLGR
ncbi:alpha/beta hydrolase [Bacillus sp. FJAT-27264]|uniref:alpha/beta fold hydrolase n=1 Tax=Paenibacillus sp. (strain DSM 101736 / FJAT-27264) TaxID=1850362 RepID=UPI0025707E0E|nr:alpha/beta hydrolase [Bacillus sp. FJAT-27264]